MVHVIDGPIPPEEEMVATNVSLQLKAAVKDARELLQSSLQLAAKYSLTAKLHIFRGEPEEVLRRQVKELEIDLVVMGTHGKKGFEEFLLGSVAQSMLMNSQLPLFGVRFGGGIIPSSPPPITSILVAMSPDSISMTAFEKYAIELAMASRARIVALFVGTGPVPFSAQIQELGTRHSVSIQLETTAGDPATVIVQQGVNYDVIVMGTRSRKGLQRFFLGSVAEEVLKRAPVPVLVCPV
eukprot:TRINITY_DN15659_c0_g1_i1.p1 TRINITY_DN15659_c0_g1~~TRINITY_DN15659_c0_g1_i1.p1  ORF type:complete len:239 (+),score=60.89 TRINITY_DN15659_c0_g1_i1:228-944(+)